MTDCSAGTFCNSHWGGAKPKCMDCSSMSVVVNETEVCRAELGADIWKHRASFDVDHNVIWFGRGCVGDNCPDNVTKEACVTLIHCNNTKTFDGSCDYIKLNTSRINWDTRLTVLFLTFLWMFPIIQDITEAATEERILDHRLAAGSRSVAAEIVRLALRIRRCFLPFLTTFATLIMLVTDDVSAVNIILNLLAVTFITEADNVMAVLLLQTRHYEAMERAAAGAAAGDTRLIFFWARLQGVLCVVILVAGVFFIDRLVKDCNNLIWMSFLAIIPWALILVGQGLHRACAGRDKESACARILSAAIELVRNYMAVALMILVSTSLTVMNSVDKYLAKKYLVTLAVHDVICLLVFIGLNMCRHRCCMGGHGE